MKVTKTSVARCKRLLTALHTLTFPNDAVPGWSTKGIAWLVHKGEDPVAFLYAEPQSDGSWYFSRVGVLASARGIGLQSRLMNYLETWASEEEIPTLVSTTYENPPSANNFVRRQWLTYTPAHPWGVAGTMYWFKKLT